MTGCVLIWLVFTLGPGSLPPGLMSKRRPFDDASSDISSNASSMMEYTGKFRIFTINVFYNYYYYNYFFIKNYFLQIYKIQNTQRLSYKFTSRGWNLPLNFQELVGIEFFWSPCYLFNFNFNYYRLRRKEKSIEIWKISCIDTKFSQQFLIQIVLTLLNYYI